MIGSVTNKLKQLRIMRSFRNTKAAIMVYKGMILPILEYGDVFLSAASAINRKWLQTLQNNRLRCALNRGIETSRDEIHTEARLLKLCFRREQHTLNFVFDSAQETSNLRIRPEQASRTRSSNKILLKLRRPCTEIFRRSLAYIGPKK